MRLLCLCVHRNMNVIIPPHPTPPHPPPPPPHPTPTKPDGWFPASMCADDRSLCADDAVSLCVDDSFAMCADDSLSMCADDALTVPSCTTAKHTSFNDFLGLAHHARKRWLLSFQDELISFHPSWINGYSQLCPSNLTRDGCYYAATSKADLKKT